MTELFCVHCIVGGLDPGGDVLEAFIDRGANAGFHDVWLFPVLRERHKLIGKRDEEGLYLLACRLVEDDDEFITTEAADDGAFLIGLCGLLQCFCENQKCLVTLEMTVAVIDRFEMIEINHAERDCAVIAMLTHDTVNITQKRPSVVQAGQRVT